MFHRGIATHPGIGRLYWLHADIEATKEYILLAEDVGISGGAASAEEAAIHIIDNGD